MAPHLPLQDFDQAREHFLRAQRILIISHKNPDADSIGANLALREALENMGKQVDSTSVDPVPESCHFLRKANTYLRDFNSADYDLFITVDCGSHKLMAFHDFKPELLDRSRTTLVNIDHHPSNDFFGNANIVLPDAPATCFILFLMFSYYGWTITPTMATALLQGLYYDTGSFMHSNTSADCLRVAARLTALGANLNRSVKEQFHSSSIPKLRLWGRALARAYLNENQAVVTAVTEQDYAEENAVPEDLSGLVNYLNHVPQAKFCVLLTEDFKGNIKGSLRTQNSDVDLSAITGLFGGGGHKKAAGFTVPGHLTQRSAWDIV
jgi:phosphoesterase RecJ-like protein